MFSLPSLAPQDSYSLWYTSSTTPHHTHFTETSSHDQTSHSQQPNGSQRRHAHHHRTPLARLRLDEEYMERRKLNVQNFGNSWLKPPGIPKTLYQQREERREMEEHQEAMRREQLAQELAEAEAEQGMDDMLLQGDGADDADGGGGERDLDDDVPEAENTGFLSVSSDDGEDAENEHAGNGGVGEQQQQVLPPIRAMITEMRARAEATMVTPATRMPVRVPDDVYREALARGEDPEPSGFDDGASTVDEEQAGMLQEEDLVQEGDTFDMDMDADLDADIPDADEPSGYEHTDTEDDLSSSDDESVDAGRLPRQSIGAATSMVRSDGTQTSMDLSSLISGSSQVGSSPQLYDTQGRRRHF